jgi:uncharacterized protein
LTGVDVPGLPFPLFHEGTPTCEHEVHDGALILTAHHGADLFVDPGGTGDEPNPDAGRYIGVPPAGDFSLSARVSLEFAQTYDAGALLVYVDEHRWAAACFEYTPLHRPTAVTVVTRGESDDANGFDIDPAPAGTPSALWLRVTRTGPAWAFHASTDSRHWTLLRYFKLTSGETASAAEARVGFTVECPVGEICTVTFDDVSFAGKAPADLRDGS